MIQNRIANIEINWGKPILIDNRENSANFSQEIGMYLISTQYVRNNKTFEIFRYVGETRGTFDKRILQHIKNDSNWCLQYGQTYIRFGNISRVPKCVDDIDHFLLTIESTIIQSIKTHENSALVNKRQVNSWTIYYDLLISNTGFRSIVPAELNTRDYYW